MTCARSCSLASTEGRSALFNTAAEYSLNAAFRTSASCALKKIRNRGGVQDRSFWIACPLDILDREEDEHPVLRVQPAVFHGQAHAVEQDAIECFGIG